MSKDPAFLFYHQDFFTGVSDMTNEETGAYIKCMCIQASKNGISEKHMSIICQSSDIHNLIKSKFVLNIETNLFENLRLKTEIEKRKRYSESRSTNRKKGLKDINKDGFISKSYDKHMENEIEIEDEIENTNEKGEKAKIDFKKIVDAFNMVCNNSPQVEKITESRKTALRKIIKENGLEKLGEAFQKVSESDFLNGAGPTGWKADFDWILKTNNFVKILEGNYQNKKSSAEKEKPLAGRMTETAIKNSINAFI
ncbi:hypothetical protein [Flavobacterium caseinilyticum]|uniref:DUF1376 domain-containing protein n=1 Tax=Flavobacterium caseinilyticum TaxID=2541732 RepID=A0A4R5B232_9FLAO|nr:hypothetical protein [Flavobacterium caseinilyticum]TDD77092.1 hypothetical protein E0F89_05705 [Flavobacterium caseinilyticum]